MKAFWPVPCACGKILSSLKGMKLHFDMLHVGFEPSYECRKCVCVRIRKRNTALRHFERRHKNGTWSHLIRIFPVPSPQAAESETRSAVDSQFPVGQVHLEDFVDNDDIHFEPNISDNEEMQTEPEYHESVVDENQPDESLNCPQDPSIRMVENVIVDVTGDIINQRVMQLLLRLHTEFHLGPKGQNVIVAFMMEILQDLSAFENFPVSQLDQISNAHKRKKYMTDHMGLVLPVQVLLGKTAVQTTSSKRRKQGVIESKVEMLLEGSRTKRKKSSTAVVNEDAYGYIIPVKSSLGLLLKNDDFYKHIINPEPVQVPTNEDSEDEVLTSEWCGNSPTIMDIFLSLSFDEAEITTPMKQAKTKHKMFIALCEILNIPMRLRGKDVTRQLLYICKASYRTKFKGVDAKLLSNLLELLKDSEDGIELIEGSNLRFRIHVVQITADNPAAASILKMKVSGGKTELPCFRCWATREEIQRNEDLGKKRRSLRAHERLCESLLHHKMGDTFEEFSKRTGIIGRSPLLDIPGFDLQKVAVDPMHSLLEAGVLTKVLEYFLVSLVTDGLVGKESLQNKLRRWRFYNPDGERSTGTLELNLQNPSKSRISYGAIAFLKMAKELPFIIHEYDKSSAKRHLFVKVMRLAVTITYAPYFTVLAAQRLRHLFISIRDEFLRLFPTAWLTNKWHALLHLIEDIPRLGAPKSFSCLQSERKYHTIKQHGVRQCKNVALTLANRTQLITLNQLFSWGRNGRESKTLEPDITLKRTNEADDLKLTHDLRRLLTDEDFSKGIKLASIGRFNFYKGSVVELSHLTDMDPVFGVIQHMVDTPNGVVLIVLKSIHAVYQPLFGYYEIEVAEPTRVLLSDLEMKVTLTSVRFDHKLYVLREYAPFIEFPL